MWKILLLRPNEGFHGWGVLVLTRLDNLQKHLQVSSSQTLFFSLSQALSLTHTLIHSLSLCVCVCVFSSVQKLWQKCMTCESRRQGQTTNWFPMRSTHTLTHSQNSVILSSQMVSCFSVIMLLSGSCKLKLDIFSLQYRRKA